MTEQEQRDLVCAIARSWAGTPYHHAARLKSIGVDCGMFLAEVYAEAGVVPPVPVEPYAMQFALHQTDERYTHIVERYAHEVAEPQKGDVAIYRFGKVGSHAAIILDPPEMIHAYVKIGVLYGSLDDPALKRRFVAYYSPWGA